MHGREGEKRQQRRHMWSEPPHTAVAPNSTDPDSFCKVYIHFTAFLRPISNVFALLCALVHDMFQFLLGNHVLREFDYADDCFTFRSKLRILVLDGLLKHCPIPYFLD